MSTLFRRIGETVLKHYKKIIAIWLLMLLLGVPASIKVYDVVVYEETKMAPEDIESERASQIIDEEFPKILANSTAMIVMKDCDLNDPNVRDMIIELESDAKKLKHFQNFTSIYSLYEYYINVSASRIVGMIYSTEENVTRLAFTIYGLSSMYCMTFDMTYAGINGTSFLLYGIPCYLYTSYEGVRGASLIIYGVPSMFNESWTMINMTAFMLYGIPSSFADLYIRTNLTSQMLFFIPSTYLQTFISINITNTTVKNEMAYNTTLNIINNTISDAEERILFITYLQSFYVEWIESFTVENQTLPPDVRADMVMTNVTPYFFNFSHAENQTQIFMKSLFSFFNITTWHSQERQSEYVNITISSQIAEMLSSYNLTKNETDAVISYYSIFYSSWKSSLKNNMSAYERAQYSINSSYPILIQELSVVNESAPTIISTMVSSFNIWNWNKNINGFSHDFFLQYITNYSSEFNMSEDELIILNTYFEIFYDAWNSTFINGTYMDSKERLIVGVNTAYPKILYYIPEDALSIFSAVYSSITFKNWSSERDLSIVAFDMMELMIEIFGNEMSMNDDMKSHLENYMKLLEESWLKNIESDIDVLEVRNISAEDAFTEYVMTLNESNRMIFHSVWSNLTFENWNTASEIYNLSADITERLLEHHIYDYVRGANATTIITMKMSILKIHELWLETGKKYDYHPNSEEHLENVSELYYEEIIKSIPSEGRTIADAVHSNLTLQSWSDNSSIHNLTLNLILSMSNFSLKKRFLEDVYDIGPEPTSLELKEFSESTLKNGTIDTYPLEIPSEFLSGFVNDERDTTVIIIGFTKKVHGKYKKDIFENVDELRVVVKELKEKYSIDGRIYVSGEAAVSRDMEMETFKDVERIDPITVVLVISLIAIFFRSIVTPAVPLGNVGVAIIISNAILFIVGSLYAKIHYSVTTLMFTLLMGAGVDYCIFILARYWEERLEGKSKEEAVLNSVTWAGESITTSGVTVMIGFGALSLGTFSMIKTMGLCLAMGIGVTILISLTLLPSLIMLVGDRIVWPANKKMEKYSRKYKERLKHGYFARAAKFSLRNSKWVVLTAAMISVPTTYLVLTLETSFDFFAVMPETESKEGIDAMGESFGEGNIMPTYVVVRFDDSLYDKDEFDIKKFDAIDELVTRIEETDNVKSVKASTYFLGERIDRIDWKMYGEDFKSSTLNQSIGKYNHTVIITVIFEEEPFSKKSLETILNLRENKDIYREEIDGLENTDIYVGGSTAGMYDIKLIMDKDINLMRIIVVIGVFIVLLVVMGSVLIPITAIISIGISISWTLAMTMLIFQYMRDIYVLWLVPLILFVILMGLGMDYNIFLITRIREEVEKGKTDEDAIISAVQRTGGIITICGAIMAGAFGTMLLSSSGLLQEFGFALAFAIILDAMIVRIYFMPSVMILLKKWNWWAPGPLQRVRRDEKYYDMRMKGEDE